MSDKSIQDKLNAVALILFDSPFKPALSKRKDFLLCALVVLLVRWPLCYILLSFIVRIEPIMDFSDESWALTVIFALPALGIFFAPYYFVLFRRLKGIGFLRPRLLTWLLFIATMAFYLFGPEEPLIAIEIIAILAHVIPYMVLVSFKDKTTE